MSLKTTSEASQQIQLLNLIKTILQVYSKLVIKMQIMIGVIKIIEYKTNINLLLLTKDIIRDSYQLK